MADLECVVRDMAMQPIREIPTDKLIEIKDMSEIRPVSAADFELSLRNIAPSVSKQTILEFERWRKEKGQVV